MRDGAKKTIFLSSRGARKNSELIFWLYKNRCVICKRLGTEINEIILRSRSKDALFWKNRVLLCRKHHEEYHHDGVTDYKQMQMVLKRKEYLISIGREEYV